uniref:DUF5688 family protein n=1 Tax=Enterocloster clostridioformis TaxID=1531 RepID=UPI001C3D94BE|nr:DUF5688 family protein [Enterocloster clostridioformis]
MEYQEFKQKLMEELRKVFPKEQGYEASVEKNLGIELLKVKNPGKEMEASMAMNTLHRIAESPEQNLPSVVELVEETVQGAEQVLEVSEKVRNIDMESYESVKPHLMVEMERSEQNGVFLSEGIYEKQAFGALVPYVSVPLSKGEIRTRITPEMMKGYGISQKELMEQAMANTRSAKPPRIIPYQMEKTGTTYYAVTDQRRGMSATPILYPGVMEELHQKIGADYYVVPINLRGVLAIGKNENITEDTLRKALREENRRHPKEWMSSKICEYNGEEKKLSVCKADKVRKQER